METHQDGDVAIITLLH